MDLREEVARLRMEGIPGGTHPAICHEPFPAARLSLRGCSFLTEPDVLEQSKPMAQERYFALRREVDDLVALQIRSHETALG
jgi:hypothetical protein